MSTATQTYLHRLFPEEAIVLGATDGTETLYEASEVFTAYRDNDLVKLGLNNPSKPTHETLIMFHDVVQSGNFHQLFGELGDLNKLCFQQSQIKAIARDHRDKLCKVGCRTTFALFTKNDEKVKADSSNVFVAHMRVGADNLRCYVTKFVHDAVWRARYVPRLVTPQL